MKTFRVLMLFIVLVVILAVGCTPPGSAVSPAQSPGTAAASNLTVATPSATPTSPLINTSAPVLKAELTTAEIVRRLRPSVVYVQTEAVQLNVFSQPVPSTGVATGIVIDAKGLIVTNNHVIDGAQRITVSLADGRSFSATVVGGDSSTDLAILRIQADNLAPAVLGDSSQLQVGDDVVAIGQALDLPGGPTVTKGVVSALNRMIEEEGFPTIENLIQTDAAINPGNSGGPLVNTKGEVIGINTARIPGGEGIGFAIAMDAAKPIINELIVSGRVNRGYLGISSITITPALARNFQLPVTQGVGINSVVRSSPAATAGLQAGDIIVAIGDVAVNNSTDLTRALTAYRAGEKVSVQVYRNGSKRSVEVVLGERPR